MDNPNSGGGTGAINNIQKFRPSKRAPMGQIWNIAVRTDEQSFGKILRPSKIPSFSACWSKMSTDSSDERRPTKLAVTNKGSTAPVTKKFLKYPRQQDPDCPSESTLAS
jgi:hypothetical protein